MQRIIWLCVVALVMSTSVGCSGGYTLSGKVISGAYTDLEIVPGDDARFSESGVGAVKILIHRDPSALNRSLAATGKSNSDGTFEVPIDAFGAGWMDESWLIQVERNGYRSGEMILRLPTGGKQLLVTMSSGQSTPHQSREDLWEQYEKYK